MQREFNLEFLLIISMTRSSPMHLLTERSRTSLIRIRSTNEFWVMSVRLDKLPNVSFTPSSWAEELENWLKFLKPQSQRLKVRLIISWRDIKGSPISRKALYHETVVGAFSSVSMGDKFPFQVTRLPNARTYVCLAIFRTEKPS